VFVNQTVAYLSISLSECQQENLHAISACAFRNQFLLITISQLVIVGVCQRCVTFCRCCQPCFCAMLQFRNPVGSSVSVSVYRSCLLYLFLCDSHVFLLVFVSHSVYIMFVFWFLLNSPRLKQTKAQSATSSRP